MSSVRYPRWRLLAAGACVAGFTAGLLLFAVPGHNQPLTHVEDVRKLRAEVCREGRVVRVRGIATDTDQESFVLDDGTGGLRFEAADAREDIRIGQAYEASGITTYDLVRPLVRMTDVHPVKEHVSPKVNRIALAALSLGDYEDQLVEVTARVVRVLEDGILERFEIERDGQRTAVVGHILNNMQRLALRNREIRIQAVVRSRFTATGRLLSPELRYGGLTGALEVLDAGPVEPPVFPQPVLRTVGEVKTLAPDRVMGIPVHLRAVITYYDWDDFKLFVQDATGAIYLNTPARPIPGLRAGMEVEVEGKTSSGDFAPIVETSAIRMIGPGRLPSPVELPPNETVSGHFDSRWAGVEGQIRGITPSRNVTRVKLQLLNEKMVVTVPGEAGPAPEGLEGATVRVQGVYGVLLNDSRQLVGVRLLVPDWTQMKVLERAPRDADQIRSIRSLRQFGSSDTSRKRVTIAGTVTAVASDSVYVEDGTGALAAFPMETAEVQPGDTVSVTGYVTSRQLRPALEDSVIRRTGRRVVRPVEIAADDVMQGRYHNALVRIEGFVVESSSRAGEDSVILQAGHHLFSVRLVRPQASLPPFVLPSKGDLLEVTGVCMPSVRMNRYHTYGGVETTGFQVLLRSAADVKVLRRASWWTLRRAGLVLVAMTGAVLVVLAWAVLLRRRVAAQTATIREQLGREASLKEAAQAASRAKSDFLANMSHEIRTPLHGILGMTDMAISAPPGAEQKEYLELVKQCGSSLLSVINDILDLSKIEAGRLTLESEPFRIRALVEDTCRMLGTNAKQKGLLLGCQIDAAVPARVVGDPGRLRQILVNLVGNATKFTERGGIDVRVAVDAGGPESVLLHFSVADSGLGIPADKLDAIFGAFEQVDSSNSRKNGGTGLGLAITRQLVKLMGGKAWAESTLGAGSTFHFTVLLAVPLADETAGADGAESQREMPPLRVLVAEDNVVNRRIATRMLEKNGHQVVAVENGQQAVDAVQQAPFDVVLMDVRMPVMDGLAATRHIREQESSSHIPIVALTAQAMKEDAEVCIEAGMDAFLTKPIRMEDLMRLLKQLLGDDATSRKRLRQPPDPG